MRLIAAIVSITLGLIVGAPYAGQSRPQAQKADKAAAIAFCREQSLTYLKYRKTIEWNDSAKEEAESQWLVAGVRDAKSPAGEDVMQIYNCRVQKDKAGWRLRMIQIFKESSKTGRDVFQLWK